MVSRLTAMLIQSNEIEFVQTEYRSEAWSVKNGARHALLLSCPKADMDRLKQAVKDIKEADLGNPI